MLLGCPCHICGARPRVSFPLRSATAQGQTELGGCGPTGQAADGVTAGDRDGLTLSWGVIQLLAAAPRDASLILLRSKHQCISCTINHGLELKRRMKK